MTLAVDRVVKPQHKQNKMGHHIAMDDMSLVTRKPVYKGLWPGETQTSLLSYKD